MKKIADVVVDRLFKYMNEQNLTQYKLAQLSGVPFPTIKSIMKPTAGAILTERTITAAGTAGQKGRPMILKYWHCASV